MKQNKRPLSFRQRFGELLIYIIDRRQYLLDAGLNRKPVYEMRRLVEKYSPYKNYRWTDMGAVRFIWKNFPELREMVPGREVNVMTELENLWLTAKNFFITENQESCKQLSCF